MNEQRSPLAEDRIVKIQSVGSDRRAVVKWLAPTLAVVVVVGIAFLARGQSSNHSGSEDTAGSQLVNYTAEQTKDRLLSASKSVLGDSLPASGLQEFVAGTADFRQLGPEEYEAADYMYAMFGAERDSYTVQVFTGHISDADPKAFCSDSKSSYLMRCDVTTTSDGDSIVTTVMPLLRAPELGEDKFKLVDYRTIGEKELSSAVLDREVRVIYPGGYLVSVTERVLHPASLSDSSVYSVSTDLMTRLASDASLQLSYPAK